MFDSVIEVVETLSAEYVEHSDVETEIDLGPFFAAALRDTPKGNARNARKRRREALRGTIRRAKLLANADGADVSLDAAVECLTTDVDDRLDGPAVALYVDYFDDLVALTALATEIGRRYPDVSLETAVGELDRAVDAAADREFRRGIDHLIDAGTDLRERAVLVRKGDRLLAHVKQLTEPRFADVRSVVREGVAEALQTGNRDELRSLAGRLAEATDGTWTREDLLACSPREFEVLVADLWRANGTDARTTKYVQDYNVDVVVSKAGGGVELVQAKRYAPGNTVGVETVQRTAGLIVEFDADAVYVVTSSSFTTSAVESAGRMEEDITLVDGERLCELLTSSPLVPPLEGRS